MQPGKAATGPKQRLSGAQRQPALYVSPREEEKPASEAASGSEQLDPPRVGGVLRRVVRQTFRTVAGSTLTGQRRKRSGARRRGGRGGQGGTKSLFEHRLLRAFQPSLGERPVRRAAGAASQLRFAELGLRSQPKTSKRPAGASSDKLRRRRFTFPSACRRRAPATASPNAVAGCSEHCRSCERRPTSSTSDGSPPTRTAQRQARRPGTRKSISTTPRLGAAGASFRPGPANLKTRRLSPYRSGCASSVVS